MVGDGCQPRQTVAEEAMELEVQLRRLLPAKPAPTYPSQVLHAEPVGSRGST